MKHPNFFIVGSVRTGTTSMHNYLNQHPEIFMCEPKEPHFFCRDLIEESRNFHKSKHDSYHLTEKLEDYLKLFKKAKNEKIIGESTTSYLASSDAAKNIYKFNPKAKILILLREPCEALHSFHSQMLYAGYENTKTLEEALKIEKERLQGKKIPTGIPWPSLIQYSKITKYAIHLKKFLAFFPRNQIKVVIFDDFKKNTATSYREVLQFLEVDPHFKTEFKIFHPHKIERFKIPQKGKLKNLATKYFPSKLNIALASFLKKVNNKHSKSKPLNNELKTQLMRQHKSEIKELSKLLDRNLIQLWDYNKI